MADIKETIQGLYALKTYLASKTIEETIEENGPASESLIGMQKVVDSAVNLLKEQEAVEPIKMQRMDNFSYFVSYFLCGNCRYELEGKDVMFCSHCGREVKWE